MRTTDVVDIKISDNNPILLKRSNDSISYLIIYKMIKTIIVSSVLISI